MITTVEELFIAARDRKFMSENTRNFCIIAHVDHGKSTLADRIIEVCSGGSNTFVNHCILDSMDIERERGITIKSQCVTLYYTYENTKYTFNLIDTPGHVDFFYEVTHALSACDGAVLLVDATQGVEAQTIANYTIANKMGIKIIPVLNKIDVPYADIVSKKTELETLLGIKSNDILLVSAKKGIGIKDLLVTFIEKIQKPQGCSTNLLQGLIIDSWYDQYFGVVVLVNIKQGSVLVKDALFIMGVNIFCKAEKIGIFTPTKVYKDYLQAGDVGFIVLGIKDSSYIKIGDTITHCGLRKAAASLSGFCILNPVVFSEIYPVDVGDFELLKRAIEKLKLNDSFSYEYTTSEIFGGGFSCGYFGVLHMDIVKERLRREFFANVITTCVTVIFEIVFKTQKVVYINKPENLPARALISEIREPMADLIIISRSEYIGCILKLCAEKRGLLLEMKHTGVVDVMFKYTFPLQEIVNNFSDTLKSISHGYATFNYCFSFFLKSDIVKLDILINNEIINGLSFLIHNTNVTQYATTVVNKICAVLKKQQFEIKVQAVIGSKIILKQIVKAARKNVLDKCYGGDRSRKDKLLQKQKDGKKKLVQHGKIKMSKILLRNIFM